MDDIQDAINKKHKDIPLTEEQNKALNQYMEEQRKYMHQRQGN